MLAAMSRTLSAGSLNGTGWTRCHCGCPVNPTHGELINQTTAIHQTHNAGGLRLSADVVGKRSLPGAGERFGAIPAVAQERSPDLAR